jgi:DNA-binding CsgD family transcriptional regulator
LGWYGYLVEELFGREQECGRLREILGRAREGLSGVLVLRGEPGAGKTALLDYAQAAADGFDVVRFDGVETEAELGFAALYQLLRPHLGRLESLPAPQRDALGLVFGLRERALPPDRFLVGLASLGLLAARVGGRPLLCVVDDAHCLDQESADVLAFIGRRLYADSIAMVFAMRESSARPDLLAGLPHLWITGLPDQAAGQLLASVRGVHPSVSARIVAETGGNPLALIEVAQELTAAQLVGDAPLPEPVPLGRALEQLYLRETRALSSDTQTLLLTAAADATGDPALLWLAGSELGFDAQAAAAAEDRQLIAIRDAVRFRHPLIRSAVYYGAPLAQRQRVHAALATATGALGDPDRRAWHLAAAATDADETVAGDLERAGERAQARGGWAAASTLLARAAALSVEQSARAGRLLAAAEASCIAGAPGQAQALLDEAAAYRADRRHTGLVQRVQARIHRLLRDPGAATSALLAAAVQLGPVDVRLARDILVEAVVQAQISGRLAPEGIARIDVARVARALPLPPNAQATVGDALLDADTVLQLEGLSASAPKLQRAIDAVRHAPSGVPELFQWLAAACADATILADDIALRELAWRLDTDARRQGAVIPLALALSHTGASELLAGMLRESERCFDQLSAIEEARGYEQSIGALLVAAWRGQADLARGLMETVTGQAARSGQGYLLVFADYARFVLALGPGRYREAYASLADRIDDTSQLKFALADLVEAAVRCGEHTAAQRLLGRLADLAVACPVPRTLGDLARARALLTDDEAGAERMYLDAVEHHENTRGPAHRARSHQVYGEWLRRARRAKEARHHLRTAYELFDGMGAAAFAARAAQELSAAGEPVPARPAADHGNDLTPQEARVAHLAAAGATNAEIASQLYLSANTVDYHLRKVFRKLGVHSRRQLHDTQQDPARPTRSAPLTNPVDAPG